MRQKLPVDTDEIDDELELLDEELKQQISEGYDAYLRGETKDLDTLIADLRNELKPQKTEGQ
jgi:benzoyl-CoA reductase/2-hydroxyglutaryl-CoA dehydratase subunit BcrC/BadD/HgdB